MKKEVPVTKKKAVKKSASTLAAAQAPPIAKTSARPKVQKTKASTDEAVAAAPVATKPKAPKKATAAKTKAAEPAPTAKPEAITDSPVEPAATTKPAKKAAVKKAPKADKGRDLVVDEPGAEEVAEVLHESPDKEDEEPNTAEHPSAEPKLERLQKILARAGISSRRKAEELILGGQVQINGQVVTALGTKADASRDHVRVDGKLLQGPERIRYFVLNKPKGFVTTVSDPEGRPTVMQFFAREAERLYPVGRLDYLSEGLLLVTNDGDLANKLTKAASGVEKTYLVKVAGQPTEDMIDVLRGGVVIERGRPQSGEGRVRTAPAKIRQVRQGDNPWYEVIIIEGRNRELRKMFEEIGHHVEKIRRVGYGPLVLDLEPGKSRELDAEEVNSLRLAAAGKLKSKKKRSGESLLPTVAGKTVRYKKADGKPGYEPRVRPEFQQESKSDADFPSRAAVRSAVRPANRLSARPDRPDRPAADRPAFPARPAGKPEFRSEGRPSRPAFKSDARTESRPAFRKDAGPDRQDRPDRSDRPAPRGGDFKKAPFKPGLKPGFKSEFKPGFSSEGRSDFKRPAPGARPSFAAKPKRFEPPVEEYVLPPRKSPAPGFEDDFDAPAGKKSGFNPDYKPGFRTGDKPAFRKDARPAGRAPFQKDGPKRFGGDRPSTHDDYPDGEPEKRVKIGIEPVPDRPRDERPRSGFDRAGSGPRPFKPSGARPAGRPSSDRPSSDRPSSARPFRPRTDGPSGGRPAGRPFSPRSAEGASEFRPRQAGPRPSGDRSGPPSRPGQFRGQSSGKPAGAGFSARPPRDGGSESRSSGPRSRPFEGSSDRPREFKPRDSKPREFKPGAPKKFGAKPGSAAGKTGPDGAPRIKERWRNSFTGKNKGRPKPKE